MDELQRFIFQIKFENAFLKNEGQAFEDMFAAIMGHAFPGDFQPVRAYGNKGDRKSDGYRASDKTIFQCYGPRSTKLDAMQAKVDTDFNGALGHWGARMERWIFVHNDMDGLPADVVQQLVDLEAANPTVKLGSMGYAELFDIVMSLTAPSATKLQANDLSDAAAGLLRVGRRQERLVERFFEQYPVPNFGEEIAQGFRDRYQALRDEGASPDAVFAELQQFAGGMSGSPEHQAAVLAVMSYFFERCDIFEDHIEEGAAT